MDGEAWRPTNQSKREIRTGSAEGAGEDPGISRTGRRAAEEGNDPYHPRDADVQKRLTLQVAAREYTAEALALTSKILKRNPEYYTVWNDRRRILSLGLFVDDDDNNNKTSNNTTDTDKSISTFTTPAKSTDTCLHLIRSDLTFLVPLLREFPKCYWIWNYRLWLLEQSTVLLPRAVARGLWQEELGLAGKMLAHDCRNFHGWGYRRTVVARLESAALVPDDDDGHDEHTTTTTRKITGKSMVEDEFAYTRRMIGTNLSNFSAWHYRTILIPRLLDERGADDKARRKFVDDGGEPCVKLVMCHGLWEV